MILDTSREYYQKNMIYNGKEKCEPSKCNFPDKKDVVFFRTIVFTNVYTVAIYLTLFIRVSNIFWVFAFAV